MKHCLLVSSCLSFFSFFFCPFFVFFFRCISTVKFQFREVLFKYQPTKSVWHGHENIYNHIQINLTTSKQEQKQVDFEGNPLGLFVGEHP